MDGFGARKLCKLFLPVANLPVHAWWIWQSRYEQLQDGKRAFFKMKRDFSRREEADFDLLPKLTEYKLYKY